MGTNFRFSWKESFWKAVGRGSQSQPLDRIPQGVHGGSSIRQNTEIGLFFQWNSEILDILWRIRKTGISSDTEILFFEVRSKAKFQS